MSALVWTIVAVATPLFSANVPTNFSVPATFASCQALKFWYDAWPMEKVSLASLYVNSR